MLNRDMISLRFVVIFFWVVTKLPEKPKKNLYIITFIYAKCIVNEYNVSPERNKPDNMTILYILNIYIKRHSIYVAKEKKNK